MLAKFGLIVGIMLVLFFVILDRIQRRQMEQEDYVEPEVKPYKMNVKFDLNHYTEKYLHRNDKTFERHKRNQTPW